MTTRIKGLTVVLTKDIRDDDIEPLKEAIKQFYHVLKVENIEANFDDYINRSVIKRELVEKLYKALE